MEIQCTFKNTPFSDDKKFYSCIIKNQQILENQDLKFNGYHNHRRANKDVIYVEFNYCKITKIPQGLKRTFPNMKMLWIMNSKLKDICKQDLVEYQNLERFSCIRNEIEFLPGNLFENTKNLDWIRFQENKLKVVEPNILDGLEKLTILDISNNTIFSEWYSVESDQNSSLEAVKKSLMQKFIDYSRNLRNSEEELKEQVQQLQDSMADLEQENLSIKELNEKLQLELEQEKLKHTQLTVEPKTGFLNDIKVFVGDETTKDFKIVINNQEIPVHKFLLAARSPTLAELLKNNPAVENLNLVDIAVDIFEIILKFFYTDEFPGDDSNFLHLFAAAGKLKIEDLKEYAATKLINLINEDNVFEIFKLSNKYEHNELRQNAFDELKGFYANYKFKEEWIAKPEIVLKAIEQFKKAEEAIRKLEEEFENVNVES